MAVSAKRLAGPEVLAAAGPVLWLAWLQALWIATNYVGLCICRSHKDTKAPMRASIISEYAVFLPVGWVLCRIFDQGVIGVYVTHPVYFVVFIAIVWTSAARHLKKTLVDPAATGKPSG